MAETSLPAPETLSYEAARDELVAIVKTLESGQAPLEDTLAMWERGEALARVSSRGACPLSSVLTIATSTSRAAS